MRVRYPVLYLLHGNAGVRNDWVVKGNMQRTVDALVEKGDMPPAIVVMPDAGTSWFVDLREKMETAFMEDLVPHVEKSYRTLTTRDGRLVAGLSMGGYGALRFALKYPEKFQAAALLSPAIYNPEPPADSSARSVKVFAQPGTDGAYSAEVWKASNYPALWDTYLQKKMPVAMYINSADDDEFFIESEASQLYALLRKNKQPAELRIVNGKHEWSVWEESLGDALKYVFRNVRRPPGAMSGVRSVPAGLRDRLVALPAPSAAPTQPVREARRALLSILQTLAHRPATLQHPLPRRSRSARSRGTPPARAMPTRPFLPNPQKWQTSLVDLAFGRLNAAAVRPGPCFGHAPGVDPGQGFWPDLPFLGVGQKWP